MQKNCVSKYRKLKGKAGEEGKENWNQCNIWQVLFHKYDACRKPGYLYRFSACQLIVVIAWLPHEAQ